MLSHPLGSRCHGYTSLLNNILTCSMSKLLHKKIIKSLYTWCAFFVDNNFFPNLWKCNLFHLTHPFKVKTNHTINLQMKNYQTCINRFIGIFLILTLLIFNSTSSCYIIFFFNTWFIVLGWCSHHLFQVFFNALFTFYCHLDHNCHVYSHFGIRNQITSSTYIFSI
jgi:hypothetical protein